MMLSRCIIDYAELSCFLIKPDNFSVRSIVDLAYFCLFLQVHWFNNVPFKLLSAAMTLASFCLNDSCLGVRDDPP